MKQWALVLGILLFPSVASAQVISHPTTNARMDGLGVENWQIEDDFNIWINPALITNYKSGIYGELGTYLNNDPGIVGNNVNQDDNIRNQWGGFHMEFAGTWGVWLSRPYGGPFAFDLNGNGEIDSGETGLGPLTVLQDAGAGTAPTANRLDLFYAPPGMPFGVYLSYANRSEDNAAQDAVTEWNIGLGGLFREGLLEAAINVGFPSSKLDPGAEDDASAGWAALVRFHQTHTGGKFLYTAQIGSSDASTENENLKLVYWRVDATSNSKPNDDTLLVLGIGLSGSALDNDTQMTTLSIPLNLAVEHQTFKRVKTRFGLSKAIYDRTDVENGADITNVKDGAATVSAGIGWMVHDNLTVDAVINQDVLFTGTYVVSGVPETLSSKISATYRFE